MSAYTDALAEAYKSGISACSDAAHMASFCRSSIQILCGALSPQLVWEGAQKRGLTTAQLVRLISEDQRAVEELMWL